MAKIEASAKVVGTAISTLAALFFVSLGVIVGVVGTVSYYQTKYGTVDASRIVKRENLYVDRETDEYSYWFRLADGTRQWGRFCDDDLAPQFSAGMFLKTLNYVEKPNCWSTHDVVPRYSIRRDNNGNAIYYANAGDAFRANQAGAAEATGHSAEAAQSAGLD